MSATRIIDSPPAAPSGAPAAGGHPCFDPAAAGKHARAHLPVAPRCNVQCNFCDRAFDCVNESRPGVSAALLTPAEAVERLDRLRERLPTLTVVGIAGPGDPLANPSETLETLRLVRGRHPDLTLCLATNGLELPGRAAELAALGVSHLTVTMNAATPATGARIYAWVRVGGRALAGEAGAARLLERQREGVAAAAAAGMTVKINAILVPGVNDGEVEAIARDAAALGARHFNLIPLLPVRGTPLAAAGEPEAALVARLRAAAGRHLPQLAHCKRCRADAAGLLGADLDPAGLAAPAAAAAEASAAAAAAPGKAVTVAVASREGLLINRHLGESDRLYVFRAAADGSFGVPEVRPLPPEGGGAERWAAVAAAIGDCDALLTAGVGEPPRRAIEERGIPVHVAEGLIAEALAALSSGRDLAFMGRRACASGCSGGARGGCGCA
jgi:nitrogen fixation protein NifB